MYRVQFEANTACNHKSINLYSAQVKQFAVALKQCLVVGDGGGGGGGRRSSRSRSRRRRSSSSSSSSSSTSNISTARGRPIGTSK